MNAVGIDVSKGKSMVAIMRPFGEVVSAPFEVSHTAAELDKLVSFIRKIDGETRIVMECTGTYYEPIAYALYEAGFYVSAIHSQLAHNYDNNTIRRVKTDKADAVKLANYALDKWHKLPRYVPQEDVRRQLKICSRQYEKFSKLKTILLNNLISLTDSTFPGVNELFTSPPRKSDGHEKWIDFLHKFWHAECVCSLTQKAFTERYRKWCRKEGYYFSEPKADDIYISACGHVALLPKDDVTMLLIRQTVDQLNSICSSMNAFAKQMASLAAMLPEYPVVMGFFGVGDNLGARIMAEIGDIGRFKSKNSLVCYAGLEAPPNDSGKVTSNRKISKKGSPHLRKALFQVMSCILQHSPADDPIFQFLDRKRSEGKHFYSYMNAGSAKFLRIYYARVTEYLNS